MTITVLSNSLLSNLFYTESLKSYQEPTSCVVLSQSKLSGSDVFKCTKLDMRSMRFTVQKKIQNYPKLLLILIALKKAKLYYQTKVNLRRLKTQFSLHKTKRQTFPKKRKYRK